VGCATDDEYNDILKIISYSTVTMRYTSVPGKSRPEDSGAVSFLRMDQLRRRTGASSRERYRGRWIYRMPEKKIERKIEARILTRSARSMARCIAGIFYSDGAK